MNKKVLSIIIVLVIVGTIVYFESMKPDRSGGGDAESVAMSNTEKALQYQAAKELIAPTGFINTEPFMLADLIGEKVILLDFWTYSCINCQRTTPYLNAWYEKYKDKGFTIVGVHTPEFEFEKQYENVERAVKEMSIAYPVVLDNDYATWRAYGNRFWPRKYLIDIDGFIRYDHIGEGAYEETESVIQELLGERARNRALSESIPEDTVSPGDADTPGRGISPETYFGSTRNKNFGSGAPGESGEDSFSVPDRTEQDTLYLEGVWNIEPEYAENESEGARIVFRYRAGDVHFVAHADTSVTAIIQRDGEPVTEELVGTSLRYENGESVVIIQEATLYNLIEGDEGEHVLEIIIPEKGLQAFTFTFG